VKEGDSGINTEDEPENLKISFDESKILPALGYTWSHFVNIRIGLQYVDDNEREVNIFKIYSKLKIEKLNLKNSFSLQY
jgi:hypothetical protein